MIATTTSGVEQTSIAEDVRRGLLGHPKTLPAYLFYDDAGSRLYESITELPEYYLTRTERAILVTHARDIAERALGGSSSLTVIELGAGSAFKTETLLRAVVEHRAQCSYVPIDVSRSALVMAKRRVEESLPSVRVRAITATYERGLRAIGDVGAPRLVLFLGSTIGNMTDDEAVELLRRIRRSLSGNTWLLLGTDLRKSPDVLHAAYDDAAGVTAAFNKNLLVRINRELGGHFDLGTFRHVARWNDAQSRVEMHLESTRSQEIGIDALGVRVPFEAGETIHTESSAKYDGPRVMRLFERSGFSLATTYTDDHHRFAVHLAISSHMPDREERHAYP